MNIKRICWQPLVIKTMRSNASQLTIHDAITWARAQLDQTSDSAQLDAEILLAYSLGVTRSYLLAWPQQAITSPHHTVFTAYIQRRQTGEPLAYIVGQREFWSLALQVTPDTLIPRPDSELLVEIILTALPATQPLHIADLGTGAGPIALALASSRPAWQVHATDRIAATLAVAKSNAQRLKITNVSFHLGFWYDALPKQKFAAIISNPPYVALADKALAEAVADFEPHAALFAGQDGLADIRHIIDHAGDHLQADGMLLVEHGASQGDAVTALFEAAGFKKIVTYKDLAGLERATGGIINGKN
jgi:release factor glutamine methyltransferase